VKPHAFTPLWTAVVVVTHRGDNSHSTSITGQCRRIIGRRIPVIVSSCACGLCDNKYVVLAVLDRFSDKVRTDKTFTTQDRVWSSLLLFRSFFLACRQDCFTHPTHYDNVLTSHTRWTVENNVKRPDHVITKGFSHRCRDKSEKY
jgi:hypothetical protein